MKTVSYSQPEPTSVHESFWDVTKESAREAVALYFDPIVRLMKLVRKPTKQPNYVGVNESYVQAAETRLLIQQLHDHSQKESDSHILAQKQAAERSLLIQQLHDHSQKGSDSYILAQKLLLVAEYHRKISRRYRFIGAVLLITTITASIVGTAFAFSGRHDSFLPWLTGGLGLLALVSSISQFSYRSAVHSDMSTKLTQILRKLEYGSIPARQVVDWWNKIDSEKGLNLNWTFDIFPPEAENIEVTGEQRESSPR